MKDVLTQEQVEVIESFGFTPYVNITAFSNDLDRISQLNCLAETLIQCHNYGITRSDTRKTGLLALNMTSPIHPYILKVHDHVKLDKDTYGKELNAHERFSDDVFNGFNNLLTAFKKPPYRKPDELHIRILIDSLYYSLFSIDKCSNRRAELFFNHEHQYRFGKDKAAGAVADALKVELRYHTWNTNAFSTKSVLSNWIEKIDKPIDIAAQAATKRTY